MIGFLQPLALLALAAASIPALLHLLGRRLPPTVVFPAVRYLTATEREHSRRLRFRNLLLLVLRTAALVFLVLAAARPVMRMGYGESHPPTALALILDNSVSSGAVVEGKRTLDTLIATAREVVARTAAGDRLWLVLSDGIPQRQTKLETVDILTDLSPSSRRLDLGSAVRSAARAIDADPLPNGPVVVVSDLQASALSPGAEPAVPVLAWRTPARPINRWLDSAYSQPEIWTPSGGVAVFVDGEPARPATVRLRVDGVEIARALVSPGDRVVLSGSLPMPGWTVGSAELDSDEMRADDSRLLALFRAAPASVSTGPEVGDFLAEAISVLQQGGRVSAGSEVTLGSVALSGVSVIFPPSDPAMVGALNRMLNTLGLSWRYAEIVDGEWALSDVSGTAEGIEVYRRYRLSGSGEVFATVGSEPWLVRSENTVLVASRMEPDWTRLPVSAAFVPFIDYLVNRIAAEESWIVSASPGDVVELPVSARTIVGPRAAGITAVPGDRRIEAPQQMGVYFLRSASGDTVGALEVNVDKRESRLQVAEERELRAAFGNDVQLLDTPRLLDGLFGGRGQIDLSGLFLVLALAAVLGEFVVASAGSQTRMTG